MSDGGVEPTRSAQGTRLNKRGVESRRRFVAEAIAELAEGGPGAVSANQVAKRAGSTWGTVQHQFGDADGLWAAVVDEISERVHHSLAPTFPPSASRRRRVTTIVETMWRGLETAESRAIEHLRLALPPDIGSLRATFPKTETALRRFDLDWEATWEQLFAEVPVTRAKLRRIRTLVPSALRGLRRESAVSTWVDAEEGVRTLIACLVLYLDDGGRP